MPRAAHVLTTAALLTLLGGCLGGDSSGPQPPPPTHGRIEGRVLDDAILPIPGAAVRVLLTEFAATTDANGFFTFPSVPAGPVRVVATADGFVSESRSFDLRGASFVRLEFTLSPAPLIVPRHETLVERGRIECGLPVGVDCQSAFPAQNNTHHFPVEEGLGGLVVELEWEAPVPGVGDRLALDVLAATPTACGTKYDEAAGTSPLHLVVEEGFPISAGHQCVWVRPGPEAVTAQQDYTLHVTLFYHQPAPADYSALT